MKNFISWVGGIVAAVIAGVLVYKFTVASAPPAAPAEITFEGMVIDKERNLPVQDTLVSFEVNGASSADAYHDLTDQNGSYGVKLSGLSKTSSVKLRFHANGYRDESKEFASLEDDNRFDPLMVAIVASPPLPPPHGATPSPTPASSPATRVLPRYIPKASIQTFKFTQQLQKK